MAAALAIACGGCGTRGGGDADAALPAGTYRVGAPVCLSTGVAPAYPDPAHKAALLDFDGLTEHTLDVGGAEVKEVLVDADCRVTVTRDLFKNVDATFSTRRNRHHAFEPDGCKLTVTRLDVSLEIGKANGAPFVDSDDKAEDLAYEATAADGGFDLTTKDFPVLSDLWSSYGCSSPDRIRQHLDGPG